MKKVEMEKEMACDMCSDKVAIIDGKTTMDYWAYMCELCYMAYGIGLGLGKGQEIIYKEATATDLD